VLQVSERKIDRVKRRFVHDGLEVALSGQPSQREYVSKVDGDVEAHLIALSCSSPPQGHARWSLRLLADRAVGRKRPATPPRQSQPAVLHRCGSNSPMRLLGCVSKRSNTSLRYAHGSCLLSLADCSRLTTIAWPLRTGCRSST